jgi:hypothetical protein
MADMAGLWPNMAAGCKKMSVTGMATLKLKEHEEC